MKKERAFTLIELLMVISIVALLASIVLASLNIARDKGRIGGANYFATQVDHIAGEQAVGIWNFDEGSGSTVADRSGFGNNGTFAGSGWDSSTVSGRGSSGLFNGTSAAVTIPYSSTIRPDAAMTVSAWIKPSSLTSNRRVMSTTASGGWTLAINENSVCPVSTFCGLVYVAGAYRVVSAPTSMISLGKWQHLAFTYDGTVLRLYLDGLEVAKTTGPGGVIGYSVNNTICIGEEAGPATCTDGEFFAGSIDDARVFTKALTANAVKNLYASTQTDHPNLAQK